MIGSGGGHRCVRRLPWWPFLGPPAPSSLVCFSTAGGGVARDAESDHELPRMISSPTLVHVLEGFQRRLLIRAAGPDARVIGLHPAGQLVAAGRLLHLLLDAGTEPVGRGLDCAVEVLGIYRSRGLGLAKAGQVDEDGEDEEKVSHFCSP